MIVGVIGIVAFGARLAMSSSADTEKIGKSMNSAASEMSSIQSRAGTSIDEAYYRPRASISHRRHRLGRRY